MSAKNTFCNYPFHHLATDTTGQYRLCCESKNFAASIKEMSLSQWWNSDTLRTIREKMLNNEKVDECEGCYHQEEKGLLSKRLKPQLEFSEVKIDYNDPRLQTFDLRPGNKCNSLCASCYPPYSSALTNEYKKWRDKNEMPEYLLDYGQAYTWSPEDWAELYRAAPHLKHVYVSGGEPFMMEQLIEFLENLSEHCALSMNSNGTVYSADFISKLEKFHNISIGFSADGVGERYNFLRYPGDFLKFEDNIKKIMRQLTKVKFEINFTLYSYNLDQIIPMYQFVQRLLGEQLSVRVIWNKLQAPYYLSVLNIPLHVRLAECLKLQKFVHDNPQLIEKTQSLNFINDVLKFISLSQDESQSLQGERGREYLDLLMRRRQSKFIESYDAIRTMLAPSQQRQEMLP